MNARPSSDPPPSELSSPWGRHPLPSDTPSTFRFGPLLLRARSLADEIWLDHRPGDWTRAKRSRANQGDGGRGDGEEEWVRWPVPEGADGLRFTPLLPPRPVVAEPEFPFRLLPRARARVFVRVPLWVRVDATAGEEAGGTGTDRKLTEVPSIVLSDTWWGDYSEGELCYWLQTTARRRVPPEVFGPHLAVCPVELKNRSDEELPVEKIVLRVAHLSLFADEGRLWADETRVRYRGPDEGSDVDVSGGRPAEAPDAVKVVEPREHPPARGIRAFTVGRLKTLPGLGGI